MLNCVAGARLLGWLVLAVGVAGLPAAEDASALVQRSLSRELGTQDPVAFPLSLLPGFFPGSDAEVAVPGHSGGIEFLRCSVTGHGTVADTFDVYLADVAPSFRRVSGVPRELLRPRGGQGLPAQDLQAYLDGRAPEGRREVVDQAVVELRKSAQAPTDPRRAAELEATRRLEETKLEAMKARLEAEEAKNKKRSGRFSVAVLGGRAARARRKRGDKGRQPPEASSSFETLDRNGDGIVTKEEFHSSQEQTEPEEPAPTPNPEKVKAEAIRQWEIRAKDWEGSCKGDDQAMLRQSLETIRFQKAEDLLARLPATCSGKTLSGDSQGIQWEELIGCVQALTNTSWKCSVCPVKFAISMVAGCSKKCASVAKGCKGRDACRARGAECLECAKQPALQLLRCAGGPGKVQRHIAGLRLAERNTEIFDRRLAAVTGADEKWTSLRRLQAQAWGVQRLIAAWGIDPQGMDLVVAPVLEALGVKTPKELGYVSRERAAGDDSSSALITEEDMAKYDADGSGSLDEQELEKALVGMAASPAASAPSDATSSGAKGGGSDKQSDAQPQRVPSFWEAARKAREAKEEAKRKAEEEKRMAEEEKRRLEAAEKARRAEEAKRHKAEVDKMLEDEAKQRAEAAARKAAEDEEAKRRAEEEAKQRVLDEKRRQKEEAQRKLDEEEARKQAEEDAAAKAVEDAKKKEQEDRRKAEEDERLRIENDPRLKAQEDEWKQAVMEDAVVAKDDAKPAADVPDAKLDEAKTEVTTEAEVKKSVTEEATKQEEEARRKAAADEEEANEKAAEAQAEEAKKKAAEEEAKKQADAEEAKRQAVAEEEAKRKAAIEEEARKKAAADAAAAQTTQAPAAPSVAAPAVAVAAVQATPAPVAASAATPVTVAAAAQTTPAPVAASAAAPGEGEEDVS